MSRDLRWWQRGVVYQIYPRSFQDTTGSGIGDLEGITSRLDYLAALGVNALWISPIYPSPMADFGYDVVDYTNIDPMFGDLAAFDRLLAAAHDRGLRLILDYVPNHTSDEHPWFIASRSARDNPKRGWYLWRNPAPNGGPPNNWESIFGGSAWTWDEATGQYYLHLFHPKQPDLNWDNPAVVSAMEAVLHFWLRRGVDGFRMDVVTMIAKHLDFPDNPVVGGHQQHVYSMNQPRVHAQLKRFRALLDNYPGDRVLIGETWFDPEELAQYYGEHQDELHLPFNFSLIDLPWRADRFRETIARYYAALPRGAWPNFVLGSHDRHRLATRLGYPNHRAVAMLLLTVRGTPTLYYGDEIGMEDGEIPPDRLQDPVAFSHPDPAEARDPERTPMQWDAGPNAGFAPSAAVPWLPLAANYQERNVARQTANPGSTLAFYRRLLTLRRDLPALQGGEIRLLDGLPDDVLGYDRLLSGNRLRVLVNFAGTARQVALAGSASHVTRLLSTRTFEPVAVATGPITLEPHEACLLQLA
jgi:alpha-glucosidase